MRMKESSFVDAGVLLRTCEHCSFQTEMLPRTFCSCLFVFDSWLSDDLGPLVNCNLQTPPCGQHKHDSCAHQHFNYSAVCGENCTFGNSHLLMCNTTFSSSHFTEDIIFRSDKFNHTGNTGRIKQ